MNNARTQCEVTLRLMDKVSKRLLMCSGTDFALGQRVKIDQLQ